MSCAGGIRGPPRKRGRVAAVCRAIGMLPTSNARSISTRQPPPIIAVVPPADTRASCGLSDGFGGGVSLEAFEATGGAGGLSVTGALCVTGGLSVADGLSVTDGLGVSGGFGVRRGRIDWFLKGGYENRSPIVSPTMCENSACTSNRSLAASHVSEICTAVSASAMVGQVRIEGFGRMTCGGTEATEGRGGRTATGCSDIPAC